MHNMGKVITILIADDHPLILEGLVNQLRLHDEFKLIGQTSNGNHAWELYSMIIPDIAVLDIEMPGIDGIELTKKIKQFNPAGKVLMLTVHTEPWIIAKAKNANPDGIVFKDIDTNHLIHVIETIASGGTYYSKEILDIIKEGNKMEQGVLKLTTRELEVLKLISDGLKTSEIADALFVSVNTIETYRKNLFIKFEVANMASLVKKATQLGIV